MSTKILITGFIWGYVFVLFEWKSGFNLFIFSFLSNNDWRKKYPSMINDQCVCVCKVSMWWPKQNQKYCYFLLLLPSIRSWVRKNNPHYYYLKWEFNMVIVMMRCVNFFLTKKNHWNIIQYLYHSLYDNIIHYKCSCK